MSKMLTFICPWVCSEFCTEWTRYFENGDFSKCQVLVENFKKKILPSVILIEFYTLIIHCLNLKPKK